MPVIILDNKPLIVGGKVAVHEDCCCDSTEEPTCCIDSPTWDVTWTGEGTDMYGDTWPIDNHFDVCGWNTSGNICTYFDSFFGTITVSGQFGITWDSINGWSASARLTARYGAGGTLLWQRTYLWNSFSFDADLTCIGTTFILAIGDATMSVVGSPDGCITELLSSVTFDGVAP